MIIGFWFELFNVSTEILAKRWIFNVGSTVNIRGHQAYDIKPDCVEPGIIPPMRAGRCPEFSHKRNSVRCFIFIIHPNNDCFGSSLFDMFSLVFEFVFV